MACWLDGVHDGQWRDCVTMMMRWLVGLMAFMMVLARRRVHDERGSLILSPETRDTSFLMVVHAGSLRLTRDSCPARDPVFTVWTFLNSGAWPPYTPISYLYMYAVFKDVSSPLLPSFSLSTHLITMSWL